MRIYQRNKETILTILFVFTILILWKTTYHIACFSAILPIIFVLIIAYSFIEIKLREKECFKNCYFKENTFLAKIVTSPYFTSIIFLILSFVYTFSFMYNSINFGIEFYFLLILFIIIASFIYGFFIKKLSNIINEKNLEIFSRELTIKITSIIMLLFYGTYFLYAYEPSYLKDTLELTIQEATNSISSNCFGIDFILRVQAEIDSTILFLIKSTTNNIENSDVKNLIWIGFIISNAFSILGLNRFIIQIIYVVNKYKGRV
ncbi:hypothetical protein [Arcobacter porcinus]|uniref:Uncharacterized protein n=1 Tax=Arcobacter porcinus TaxID=1935204 RepID=A0ABX2YCZ9_9BACT|nr:hypothetical protein [Arcobacter porcinus]OCL83645.1 hypothetical protein AAW30_00883 [Arcobacter porcinus]OCL83864.1 hypothetical protein AAW29_00695 [Arcobacter porcinus]OCL85868.1 hypothetical protein AAX30_01698 [Arcobacter porcinus]OCL92857.1 hypothetical protein AAX28_00397 [Arcobacter porcinus]